MSQEFQVEHNQQHQQQKKKKKWQSFNVYLGDDPESKLINSCMKWICATKGWSKSKVARDCLFRAFVKEMEGDGFLDVNPEIPADIIVERYNEEKKRIKEQMGDDDGPDYF